MLEPAVETTLVLCSPTDRDGGVFSEQCAHPRLVPRGTRHSLSRYPLVGRFQWLNTGTKPE